MRVSRACGIVSALAAAACTPPPRHPMYRPRGEAIIDTHQEPRQVAAPPSLDGTPWKLGQWAAYRTGGAVPGYETIGVFAIDGCGVWIVDTIETDRSRRTYRLCFAPDPQATPVDRLRVAILVQGDRAPLVFDFRDGQHAAGRRAFASLVDRFEPPHGRVASVSPREDVAVPAGQFAQAARVTEAGITRWIHPAVPFGGIVKSSSPSGDDLVLLAYGDHMKGSYLAALAGTPAGGTAPRRLPPAYAMLALGLGHLTGHGGEAASDASPFDLGMGVTMTRSLDVIAQISVFADAAYTPDPTQSQTETTVVLGARWWPFRLPWRSAPGFSHPARRLWLQADAGYAELFRASSTTTNGVAGGLALGATIGWQVWRAHDWSYVIGLEDELAALDHGEGVRSAVGLMLGVTLEDP